MSASLASQPENTPDIIEADVLYRQGMAHYRAHQWAEARACFLRLRALDAERRGIDSLISELDHFIRLEEVRPAITAPQAGLPAGAPRAQNPRQQRLLLAAIPAVAVIVIVATAALAGSGIFVQGAVPSPSVVSQTALLPARAVSGKIRLLTTGSDAWQDWSNGRLLRVGDRMTTADMGVIELTLPDGRASLQLNSDAMIEVTSFVPESRTAIRQAGGRAVVQTESRSLQVETPHLFVRNPLGAAAYEVSVDKSTSRIGVTQGQIEATAGGRSLTAVAGQDIGAGEGAPLAIIARPTATPPATATVTAVPTATPTTPAAVTSTATASPTATATQPVPPIETPAPVAPTATPIRIPTLAVPTAAPPPAAPTATPAPPTNTPVPPTPTPVPPTPTPRR